MAIRDDYRTLITGFLAQRGDTGATTNEIIDEVHAAIDNARGSDRSEDFHVARLDQNSTGWGVRAALNRLWKKGDVEKAFEYRDRAPRNGVNPGPVRVYRYFAKAASGTFIQPANPTEPWYKRTGVLPVK
jgi:hypothetical protein